MDTYNLWGIMFELFAVNDWLVVWQSPLFMQAHRLTKTMIDNIAYYPMKANYIMNFDLQQRCQIKEDHCLQSGSGIAGNLSSKTDEFTFGSKGGDSALQLYGDIKQKPKGQKLRWGRLTIAVISKSLSGGGANRQV